MNKKNLLLIIFLGVFFILTIALWHEPQAQAPMEGGPPGAPNMMGGFREQMAIAQALPLESSWTFLSFEVELSDEALIKARKLYQDAWNQRKEKITDKMDELRGDPDAMAGLRTEAEKIWSNLKAKLNEVLTPDQSEKFANWEKENKNQARRMPGGGGEGGNRRPRQ